MNHLILEQVIKLANVSMTASQDKKQDYLIQAQDLLLEHLAIHSRDTDAWLLLTLLECNPPFYDPERIIQYASAVLAYDEGNVYALLFLSYADYYLMGGQDSALINKLSQAKSDDQDFLSLIEIAKARFWEFRNQEEYEKCLLRSIELCKTHVTSYTMLGEFYIQRKRYKEGILILKQALFNLNRVFTPYNIVPISPADMNSFLDEFFVGTVMNYMIYNQLNALINEYEDVDAY